jgi:hypothetical protein
MVRLNQKAKKKEMPRLLIPAEPAIIRVARPKPPSPKKVNGEDEIAKYCQELGACFDVEKIAEHFQ